MKTIKYRKYEHTGDYKLKELNISDGSTICEIDYLTIHHHIKNLDEYTKSYILISPEEFSTAIPIGNMFVQIIDNVYIEHSDIAIVDIESAPRIKDVYYILPYINENICKLRKFTSRGIEVSYIHPETMSITEFKYGMIFLKHFTSDPKVAQSFNDKATKLYNSVMYE